MNKGNRAAKKAFALLLSFVMVVCMMPGMAFADIDTYDAGDETTAQVSLTAQADNQFLCLPGSSVQVSSKLAESYGYTDEAEGVSALDVMVKAHEMVYGEDFTESTKDQYLKLYSDGQIQKCFGNSNNAGFMINGKVPHDNVLNETEDSYTPYTLAECEVQDGDEINLFVYQNAQNSDLYTYFTDTTVNANKVQTLNLATGAEYRLLLKGYSVYHYGASPDAVISQNTVFAAGAKLCLINKENGLRTELDAEVGSNGRVTFTAEQEGDYFLSAYIPSKDISGGKAPIIMPAVSVHVAAAPKLGGVTFKDESGAKKYVLQETFEPEKFEGYTLVVPDFVPSITVYPTLREEDQDGGYIFGAGDNSGLSYNSEKIEMVQIKSGSFQVCIADESHNKLKTYQFNVRRQATLKSLSIDGFLQPDFDPSVGGYHAYVDGAQEAIPVTVTPYADKYTILIDGQEVTNGGTYQLPVKDKWSEEGTIDVSVKITSDDMEETVYKLTLEKQPAEATPAILEQPRSAGYIQGTGAAPLTVKASAAGTLSYQWYSKTAADAGEETLIEGATESSYTPLTAQVGDTWYYCKVKNSSAEGQETNTEAVKIAVYDDPSKVISLTITNPGEESVNGKTGYCYSVGQTPTDLKAKMTVQEGAYLPEDAVWTYTWPRGTTERVQLGSYGQTIGRDENPAYSPDTTVKMVNSTGNWIRCQLAVRFNGTDYKIKSDNTAYVYVKADESLVEAPVITTQPMGSDSYIINQNPAALKVAVASLPTGGIIWKPTYQWYSNSKRSTEGATKISGATSSSYTPPTSVTAGSIYYYCVVTNTLQGISKSTTSDIVRLTFKEDIAADTWTGDGTEEKPYLLKTEEDLNHLAKYVNQGYSFEGKYFALDNDISLSNSWAGIGRTLGAAGTAKGSQILPFSGILDGKGHTLTFAEGSCALFSYVREATVKNLNIQAPYMKDYALVSNYVVDYGTDDDYYQGEGGSYAPGCPDTIDVINVTLKSGSIIKNGGFIGGGASGANVCNFINCTVEDNVKIGWDKDTNAPAGLNSVGSFAGSISGTFVNCVSYADLYGNSYVGGIAATKAQSMGPYDFRNCAFLGSINATGEYVGGIAGVGYYSESAPNTPCAKIQNCYVAANIVGKTCVGGIFGGERGSKQNWGQSPITDNHFAGTVKATETDGYIGGIVGYMSSLNKNNVIANNYYISNCGTDKGIGGINTEYLDVSSANYGRTDDPLGKDADTLAKAMTAAQFGNGTVTKALNSSDTSYKNWVDGENGYPVHSSEPVAYRLDVSGEYKTEYYIGDELDLSGIMLTATFSDGSSKTVDLAEVDITGYDKTTRSVQTLTLTYGAATAEIEVTVLKPVTGSDEITVYLTLLGDDAHNSDSDGKKHTLSGGNLQTWISRTPVKVGVNGTAREALEKAAAAAGLTLVSNPATQYGWYLEGITKDGVTLSEFTNGTNSGWMYTVNGTHPEISAGNYFLNDGDVIVWHYTDDYTVEQGSEKWNTPEETLSVSKDIPASIKGDSAEASVSASDMAALVDAVKKDGSAAVQLNVTGADKVSEISLELPKTSLNDLATKTDAALNVKTALGSVSMDKTTLKTAVNGASGDTVKLVLTKVSDTETDVKLVSGGKSITDLGAGKLTISLPVSDALKDKTLAAAYTSADGKLVKISGKLVTIGGKQYYQIETSQLGTFTLDEETAIDAAIKAQGGETDEEKAERIKAGVQATTIKLRSTFSKKNNIQLKWTKSKGYKVDYYEVFKSTKRFSGFGTKAYYKTSTGTKNTYINTKELKKGARYFYKVRGVRVINGEKVYTQWSNKAWRISRVNRK